MFGSLAEWFKQWFGTTPEPAPAPQSGSHAHLGYSVVFVNENSQVKATPMSNKTGSQP